MNGQFIRALAPTSGSATNNSLHFDSCKFESSGLQSADPSPIYFEAASTIGFTSCFFAKYGKSSTGSGYCMELKGCAAVSVDALCLNNTATPAGFAQLTSRVVSGATVGTSFSSFTVRGSDCGGVSLSENCRQVTYEIFDSVRPFPPYDQSILHYPPVNPIDIQQIARASSVMVNDSAAPRGRALQAANVSSGGVMSVRLGGPTVSGVTVFARVRLASGSGTPAFAFLLARNYPPNVTADYVTRTFKLSQFTPTSTYSVATCVVPRSMVLPDTYLRISSVTDSTSVLSVAEIGWLQGMFADAPPVTVGSDTEDAYLKNGATFEVGERILRQNTMPTTGNIDGWACTGAGTTNKGNPTVTASTTTGSPTVTLSTPADIFIGSYLTIGTGSPWAFTNTRVIDITYTPAGGMVLTMAANAAQSGSSNSLYFYPPTFQGLG